MSIIGSGHALLLASEAAAPAGPLEISRSLRFNSADSAYLNRTPGSAGNRKTWTWAGWVKLSEIPNTTAPYIFQALSGSNRTTIKFDSDKLYLDLISASNQLVTTQVFRDPSAWYHIVAAVDTTDATSSNRAKLYVNGVQVTAFSTATYPSQNADTYVNSTTAHYIGAYDPSFNHFNGYLADVHFVDGQALDPTSFGEFDATTGVWNPIAYTGSHGSNGFYLTFSDNSGTSSTTLGKDAAGSNNWTPNNFSVASGSGNDSLVDVPQNGDQTDTGVGGEVRGNYATLNPLQKSSGSTLSNGNLDISMSSAQGTTLATMAFPASGKWYFECTANATECDIGIAKADASLSQYLGNNSSGYGYYKDGNVYHNNSSAGSGATYTTGDVIGVAFDADAGTCKWYKNNSLQVTISSLSGEWFPAFGSGGAAGIFNFGSRSFAYSAPSNHKALCTTNLPDPTITDPSDYMDVLTWTGDGNSTRTISGLSFSPDFVWIKERPVNGWQHVLYDIIRGPGTSSVVRSLSSDSTRSEAGGNDTNHGYLSGFNSDGFDLVKGSQTTGDYVNHNNWAYVGWTWDGGSSTVSNTDGSITSSVRANASAGFSIVTYTAPASNTFTVGHGLNAVPELILVKGRNQVYSWDVYHKSLGATKRLMLNLTNAAETTSGPWNNTAPTSSVFSSSGNGVWYNSGDTLVAYCFAPVEGYSAFGSYVGTGSATNSPFIWTGFRPQWILVKNISINGSNWRIVDAARNTYNEANLLLNPNSSNSEQTTTANEFDFLSNGFKLRGADNDTNGSGETLIYYAVAENPFKYARAR